METSIKYNATVSVGGGGGCFSSVERQEEHELECSLEGVIRVTDGVTTEYIKKKITGNGLDEVVLRCDGGRFLLFGQTTCTLFGLNKGTDVQWLDEKGHLINTNCFAITKNVEANAAFDVGSDEEEMAIFKLQFTGSAFGAAGTIAAIVGLVKGASRAAKFGLAIGSAVFLLSTFSMAYGAISAENTEGDMDSLLSLGELVASDGAVLPREEYDEKYAGGCSVSEGLWN